MSAAKRSKTEDASTEPPEVNEAALKADEEEAPLENGANDGDELEGAAGEEAAEGEYEYEAAENEFLSALEEVQEKLIEVGALCLETVKEWCTSSQRLSACNLLFGRLCMKCLDAWLFFPPRAVTLTTSCLTDGFIVLVATGERRGQR